MWLVWQPTRALYRRVTPHPLPPKEIKVICDPKNKDWQLDIKYISFLIVF